MNLFSQIRPTWPSTPPLLQIVKPTNGPMVGRIARVEGNI